MAGHGRLVERRRSMLMTCGSRRVDLLTSGVAIGIGGAVAAFEPHLMRAMRGWPSHKKLGIEGDATIGAGVELHHPAVDAIRIELGIDGPIERIGEVDPLTITADLDHLWAAAERPV